MFKDSPWKPAVALFAVVVAIGAALRFGPASLDWLLWVLLACVIATALLAFRQMVKFGPARGVLNGCASVLAGACGFVMLLALGMQQMMDPGPDPFGRDLQIPKDLVMREPRDSESSDAPTEPWSKKFEAACDEAPSTPSKKVTMSLEALNRIRGPEKARLVEYLSRSRLWHVTEERGNRYAYRRFSVERAPIKNSLHGYYSSSQCQFRVIIGLDGAAMAEPWTRKGDATVIGAERETAELRVGPSASAGRFESYLVVEGVELAVEIFDERLHADRALTTLGLELVAEELARFEAGQAPDDGLDAGLRTPSIELTRGFQGGLYLVTAEVNPGEPGAVYLQAYEHTKNTRLSEDRLTTRSRSTIGWSKNPAELFHYDADITIYEGDWEVYYPARLELWFEPASGAPQRKLIEDVFRIDGWQR